MMPDKNTRSLALVIMMGTFFLPYKVKALNLGEDTIYVNTKVKIRVKFPTAPKKFFMLPAGGLYAVKSINKGIVINATSENALPVTLFVSEANRSHTFILTFKEYIDQNDAAQLSYDYSHIENSAKHITGSGLARKGSVGNAPISANTGEGTQPSGNAGNYYALLERGDRYLQEEKYQEAKTTFDEAHALRPADMIPVVKLQQIGQKLAASENLAQEERNRMYDVIIARAIILFDQKKYDEAGAAFKQALNLKPGDLYAKSKLSSIIKLLPKDAVQNDPQTNRYLYTKYIAEGRAAFDKKQFADAKVAYNKALLIKKDDALATRLLESAEKGEQLATENQELENHYSTIILAADKFFAAGDYANAKLTYATAARLIKRPWPEEQLKKIAAIENTPADATVSRLVQEKREKETTALQKKYDAAIIVADSLFKAGNYKKAKAAYIKAAGFIQKEWATNQVSTINNIISNQSNPNKIRIAQLK